MYQGNLSLSFNKIVSLRTVRWAVRADMQELSGNMKRRKKLRNTPYAGRQGRQEVEDLDWETT